MLEQKNFVETKLATKFAKFNIRVYKDHAEKETFALWTDHLDMTQPVLVRIHSECITGDMLNSLHCDCGKQLNKSLQLISREGGVLIYLRQEGRGIGLFEKMKSYKLQSEGYDTFEANVLLGHNPDQRSYEMVKTILDDLGIKSIKILTNNPSKVSDIAKLGIDIVERIPLIAKPNEHNKKYLETKKNKFKHFIKKSPHHYFYQFHADSSTQVHEIIDLINNKNKDPFLKICVGITVKPSDLENRSETENIHSVVRACKNHKDFIPVIHYSFINSQNILEESTKIKQTFPDIHRLQLNDIQNLDVSILEKISELFEMDIPLCDASFEIVHNKRFRELAKKTNSFIMLDNSKGKGIKESKESLTKKIDILIAYGLNNIALCGGFGPDNLNIYFEIKRYYRFNFSIDAETNLKTNGKIDSKKNKIYIHQLLRSDEPKDQGVKQTKKFLEEHRHFEWTQTSIQDRQFSLHPKVFQAGHFPSTAWFATQLQELLKSAHNFCEIGCGAGVISCLASLSNPKLQIIATDINPHANENTTLNAKQLGLDDKISVLTGDVLDSVKSNSRFDLIFWALPFGFLDPGTPITLEEAQVFDPGYRAIRKLLHTARQHLAPGGRLLLGFSSDLGHYELLQDLAQQVHANLKTVATTTIQEDVKLRFEILEVLYKEDESPLL